MRIYLSKKNRINIKKLLLSFLLITIILLHLIPNISLGATYNQQIISANKNNKNGIDAFPESYQTLLKKLVETTGHDNWKFKPLYTDISWSELTSMDNENKHLRNTIYKNPTGPYPADWYCSCGQQGDTNYYCASRKNCELLSRP